MRGNRAGLAAPGARGDHGRADQQPRLGYRAARDRGMQILAADATAIIIAHRLSTIRHASSVAVMEHGRIAQEGSPSELLSQPGLYARVSRYQQAEPVGLS